MKNGLFQLQSDVPTKFWPAGINSEIKVFVGEYL